MTDWAIHALIRRGQAGLNRIIVARAVAAGAGLAAACAGCAVLMARMSGWTGGMALWAGAVAAGGLAGFVKGWINRIDRLMAARWLDRRLALDEAMSAALVCLERGCAEPLDEAAVARAEALAEEGRKIAWPVRRLKRGLAIATAVCLGFGSAVLLVPARQIPFEKDRRAAKEAISPAEAPAKGQKGRAATMSPREMARLLFPEHPGLAGLAEQALAAGDLDMLQRLLTQAQREMDAAIARAASPEERRRLQAEQERRQRAAMNMMGGNNPGAGMPGQEEGEDEESQGSIDSRGGEGGEEEGRGQAGNGRPSTGGGQRRNTQAGQASQEQGGYGAPGQEPDRPGDLEETGGFRGSAGSGLPPGRGRGSDQSDWGRIAPRAGGQKQLGQENGPQLELVLPGKGPGIPLAQAVPGAGRTAESALARRTVPGEYRDCVQWYFQRLTGEVAAPVN